MFGIVLVGIALGFSASRTSQTEKPKGLWRTGLLAITGAAIAGGVFAEAAWQLQGTERDMLWHFGLAGAGALAVAALALLPAMRPSAFSGGATWLVLLAYSLWIYPAQVISGAENVANGNPYCVATIQSDASVSARADLSLLTHPKRRDIRRPIGREIPIYYSRQATGLSMVFRDPAQENSMSDGLAWAHWQPFRGWIVPALDAKHSGMPSTNCHLHTNWAETLPRGSDLELTAHVATFQVNGVRLDDPHIATLEFAIPSTHLAHIRHSVITIWVDGIDLAPLDQNAINMLQDIPHRKTTTLVIDTSRLSSGYRGITDMEQWVESDADSDKFFPTVAGCESYCGISTTVEIGSVGLLYVTLWPSDAYKSVEDLGDWEAKAEELRSFARNMFTGP